MATQDLSAITKLTDEQINLNSAWKDGEITKSILYNVYGMNAFYGPYGDEKISYTFTPGIKSVDYTWEVQADFEPEEGKTYRELQENPTTIPTVGILNEIVKVGVKVEETTTYTYYKCTEITETPNLTSTITIKKGSDNDYKGELVSSDVVEVTITPSADLKTLHPGALVSIDGKEYTLGVLTNPITLYMNRDHRISINWIHNELVETFLIIARR
jgi:hypothetical protein